MGRHRSALRGANGAAVIGWGAGEFWVGTPQANSRFRSISLPKESRREARDEGDEGRKMAPFSVFCSASATRESKSISSDAVDDEVADVCSFEAVLVVKGVHLGKAQVGARLQQKLHQKSESQDHFLLVQGCTGNCMSHHFHPRPTFHPRASAMGCGMGR